MTSPRSPRRAATTYLGAGWATFLRVSLRDVTSPEAVLSAIAEFDRIGRNAFLDKYGFQEARGYFVDYGGVRYDSKPIAAAAHGYQHGKPLENTFSGGNATVARQLEGLGFSVTRPGDPTWSIDVGTVTTRAEVAALYGGSTMGGIQPSNSTPNVLVYSDPASGTRIGYQYDGADPNEPGVFYYTGEGRVGNQQLTAGNKAILEHAKQGRVLRLFEAVDGRPRRGGKLQRYLGEYAIDAQAPFRFLPAPDADARTREVVVFRLLSQVAAKGRSGLVEPALSSVIFVDSEKNTIEEFEVSPTSGGTARRVEAALVGRFEAYLRLCGITPTRVRISPPGETTTLVTDPYVESSNVLYEAKGTVDRGTIRLAIGQLLDYLRFIPDAKGCLLLPSRPSDDLLELIESCGFGLVHESDDAWVHIEPTQPGAAK